jgi:hypothetical protein
MPVAASDIIYILHCKKRLVVFPSKKLLPAMESLVSDIPAGDGKTANLFLQCMCDSHWVDLSRSAAGLGCVESRWSARWPISVWVEMPHPSPPLVAQSTAATIAATAAGTRPGITGILETLANLEDYTGWERLVKPLQTGDKECFNLPQKLRHLYVFVLHSCVLYV